VTQARQFVVPIAVQQAVLCLWAQAAVELADIDSALMPDPVMWVQLVD
jgi:hypothetical protein